MLYRVWRFFRAALARVRVSEVRLAEEHLSPAQMALFLGMARCDQRHCLDVFHTLYDAGHRDVALLQAALIHDVGKSAGGLTLFHRSAVVLMQRYAPALLCRLATNGSGWRRPFVIHVRHARLSAERAQEAGSSSAVVALIRDHHSADLEDNRSVALLRADESN